MAEGEGFEPPVPFQAQRFSRPPVSTAHPSLRRKWSHIKIVRPNRPFLGASVPTGLPPEPPRNCIRGNLPSSPNPNPEASTPRLRSRRFRLNPAAAPALRRHLQRLSGEISALWLSGI